MDTNRTRITCPNLSRQIKTVFSSPRRISRLDKTVMNFLLPTVFFANSVHTADTDKTRQDSLVLSESAVWTRHNDFLSVFCHLTGKKTSKKNKRKLSIAVRNRNHHHASGNHRPYKITECYLPPGSGDFPALPALPRSTQFCILLGGYIEYQLWLGWRQESHLCRMAGNTVSPARHLISHRSDVELLYSHYFTLLYASRSWYSILRPRRDARLSWPEWCLHPKIV